MHEQQKGQQNEADALKEFLLHRWSQILSDTQRLNSDVDVCDSCCLDSIGTEVGDAFLQGNVVGILNKEVRLRGGYETERA